MPTTEKFTPQIIQTDETEAASKSKMRIKVLTSILTDEIQALAKMADDTPTKTAILQAGIDLMTAAKRVVK